MADRKDHSGVTAWVVPATALWVVCAQGPQGALCSLRGVGEGEGWGAQPSLHCWVEAVWGFFPVLEHLNSYFCSSCFPAQSALPVFPPISSCTFFISPGKDARLFVFRLSSVHKAIEGKQAVKSKCDCRDNKLEKTKGNRSLRILVVSVQFFFFLRLPRFHWK